MSETKKSKDIVEREKRRKETMEEALTSKDFYSLKKVLILLLYENEATRAICLT